MLSVPVALLTLLPFIDAQSTVSLYLPGFDSPTGKLVGSIAGSDKTATTYVVTCAPQASSAAASATPTFSADSSNGNDQTSNDDTDCAEFPGPLTLTQGPSTVILPYTLEAITATINCKLDGTTSAICTASQTGANDHLSTETEPMETVPSVMTISQGPADVTFLPVTITAGAADDEVSAASTSSTDAGATANPAAGTVKSTGSTKTGAAASTRGSSSSPVQTSKSTNKASPAAATSTGGATLVGASSALGGSVILVMGLAAAML
ncbi:nudix hydrolase 14, chloroplastic [Physcia stellaris]|nr:nudix hydrolase 14, chloroplastic [Physcia stellaris]